MIEFDTMHMKQDWLIPVLRTGQGQVFFKVGGIRCKGLRNLINYSYCFDD